MANKRMFTMKICDSDAFLEMPISAQCLYFHLNMRADDDGFVGNPKKIIKIIGANEDDLRILITKRFLLTFEGGVIVIKHWRMHNTLSTNRYHETQYQDEKAMLLLKANGSYSFDSGVPLDDKRYTEMHQNKSGGQLADKWQTNGGQMADSDLDLDIDLDREYIDIGDNKPTKRTRFVKPTLDDLEAYKQEKNLNVDCSIFFDHYEANGWRIGKVGMKDWKAAMRRWSRENDKKPTPKPTSQPNRIHNFDERRDDLSKYMVRKEIL